MKNVILLFIVSAFISCENKEKTVVEKPLANTSDTTTKVISNPQADTGKWINSFREFRDAVYKGDKAKAKQFFEFPINTDNEIWYLGYLNDKKVLDEISKGVKPFTEKDFDRYFDGLFSKRFVTALLKVKTEDLFNKGYAETPELQDGKTSYKIIAEVNKEEKILMLNLASNTDEKDEKGEYLDGGEFSIVYFFTIIDNSTLKFKQIRTAG